jgi:anti-sigma regulatory factor (Ser/Thr protein kinase)
VATARLLVRTALAGREPGQIDDALLVVSELMTNAIREATQPVELRIGTATERVRLTVTDCSPGEPCLRDASPDSDHGRGLYLVDAIAESWGWVPGAAGKTVWAEL